MVEIDRGKCIGCGACVADCISGALKLSDGKAEYTGRCILCGHCVAICPVRAPEIPSYDMGDVEEITPADCALDSDKLLRAIKFRRSIRKYKEQKIEREKLERIVQAGRYTATAVNRQACRFLVVQEELGRLKDSVWKSVAAAAAGEDSKFAERDVKAFARFVDLRAQGTDYFFRNAPAVIYIAAENTVDAALAAQNMELAALSQGLGVLYNGYLVRATAADPASCDFLGAEHLPLAICMLVGYPDRIYRRTAPRKPADVRWR